MGRRCGVVVVGAALASVTLVGCNLGAQPVLYDIPAQRIVSGDINGDGHLDFLSYSPESASPDVDRVGVLLGDGTGGFSKTTTSEPGRISRIALADVDGDGDDDRVDQVQEEVVIDPHTRDWRAVLLLRRSTGDGGFESPVEISRHELWDSAAFAFGDLNEDGRLDLASAGTNPYSEGGWVVRMGDGSGGFGAATTYGPAPERQERPPIVGEIEFADLNLDGHLDLVGVDGQKIWVGLGDGTGRVTVSYQWIGIGNSWEFVLADVTEDGRLDFLSSCQDTPDPYKICLRRGEGTGQFGGPENAGPDPSRFATGDIDGDGHLDLVVTGAPTGVRYGDGTGQFPDAHGFGSGTWPFIADLDGDGKPDVILVKNLETVEGQLAVYMNRTDGRPAH